MYNVGLMYPWSLRPAAVRLPPRGGKLVNGDGAEGIAILHINDELVGEPVFAGGYVDGDRLTLGMSSEVFRIEVVHVAHDRIRIQLGGQGLSVTGDTQEPEALVVLHRGLDRSALGRHLQRVLGQLDGVPVPVFFTTGRKGKHGQACHKENLFHCPVECLCIRFATQNYE